MKQVKHLCITALFLAASLNSGAQQILSRTISLQVNRQRLDNVLEIISNKANFYFSYNSSIIKKDSLVSFSVSGKTIRQVLGSIFDESYEFKESGNYLIIRKAPLRITVVTKRAELSNKFYAVEGYVYDEQSGAGINEASVYEKKILASAFTNTDGRFKIKLKNSRDKYVTLVVSKTFYNDATLDIEPNINQEVTITMLPEDMSANTVTVSPEDYISSAAEKKTDSLPQLPVTKQDTVKVEKLGLSRFLLSARQKVQSLNLKNFFTTRPYQVSFTPKLSTHGYLSAQVVNGFSLNILGGYTAGTNGFEAGGLFNIDKKNVQYFQVAGLFNAVGGKVRGFQSAGLSNIVLDTVKAFQSAGINNIVKGTFSGFQSAGVYNHVTGTLNGFQSAGVGNFVNKKVAGVQVAGVVNLSNTETEGVQISGVINYSKKLRGLQIGLVNVADTSAGCSIGLINVVLKNGYHKLSLSTNELMNTNAALKTGTRKFHSILMAGINYSNTNKIYAFGYGLGSELGLNKQKTISVNPELSCQYLYLGSWDYSNLLNKFNLNLNVKLNKYVSLYAGPSFNLLRSDQHVSIAGYAFPGAPNGYRVTNLGTNLTGWFGWNAGINFF